MTQIPLETLKELSKRFPPPQLSKQNRALSNIELMAVFYEKKTQERSGKISQIFKQYAITLMYVCAIIKIHRQLTEELARLAGEATNEQEVSSP